MHYYWNICTIQYRYYTLSNSESTLIDNFVLIPKVTVDENGNEYVEVGSHRKGIVEELEKAHIYISELEERLSKLEQLLSNSE